MSKMTHAMSSAAVSIATLMLMASAQAADAQKPQITDMNAFLCKDIVRMSGEDRTIALAVLNGYYLGKAGATQYVSSELGKATDEFVEHCLDHPKDPALSTFAKFAK